MARPKSVSAEKSIEVLIDNKIERVKNEIAKLQKELDQLSVIKADYDKNRTTIETILGLQSAPDLAVPRKTRVSKK
ncbi:hypothetical protein [Pedobacter gandavensis]|uniref:hypothetical protein n=1 Tax=Pedobacter gandavensis TaxID=2679963 RepID=UPI00292D9017|nr:hypothetical protein [Pedobacter gandavensis]